MDVWECDLIDVQALSKFNDNHKYLLTAIDVFSKFLNVVPLKSKMGPAVTSAFQSILKDPKYSTPLLKKRPIWMRTDRGKEFLNKNFQDMLKREGTQFQVCRNPDVKYSVVERAQRMLREKLYDILPIEILTDTLTSSHNSFGLITKRCTLLLAWLHQKSPIQTFSRYGRRQTQTRSVTYVA